MPRKMIWIEKPDLAAWGCSECAWLFQTPSAPTGKSLDQMLQILEAQRDKEFASHICAYHPKDTS